MSSPADAATTLEVVVTQFMLPDGRQREITCSLPDDPEVEEGYRDMQEGGCRLTAEILTTGVVSVCIEHPEHGDFDIALVPNGPPTEPGAPCVPQAIGDMLKRFDLRTFQEFVEAQEAPTNG